MLRVEAAALGRIRRLKPHIVYNYDATHDEENETEEEETAEAAEAEPAGAAP